tara:strand:+ start:230 stop:940 length:711 start_codon:yes stop_codon:yes gene_type:complete
MTIQNKSNQSFMSNIEDLKSNLSEMASGIDQASRLFTRASEIAVDLIDRGMTNAFFISCYNESGFNFKKDVSFGIDCATEEQNSIADEIATDLFFANLKTDSKNATKMKNAIAKFDKLFEDEKAKGIEHRKAYNNALKEMPNKVNNINYRDEDYSEKGCIAVLRKEIKATKGQLKRFMSKIENKKANENKPKTKKKVLTLNQEINNRLNEIKELIGKADPKALAKLPDTIKDYFKI